MDASRTEVHTHTQSHAFNHCIPYFKYQFADLNSFIFSVYIFKNSHVDLRATAFLSASNCT